MQTLFSNPLQAQRLSRSIKAACFALGGVFSGISPTLHAQSDNWWFDVEVILFKRLIDGSQLRESFPYEISPVDLRQAKDLISERLSPDTRKIEQLLPLCYHEDPSAEIQLPLQTAPAFRIDETLFAPHNIEFTAPSLSEQYSALEEQAVAYDEFEHIQQSEARTQKPQTTQAEPSLETLQMAFSMPEDEPTEPAEAAQSNETQNTLNSVVSELNQDGAALEQSSEMLASEVGGADEAVMQQDANVEASFAPDLLQSDTPDNRLIQWQVPSSLACRFEEQAPVALPFPDSVPNPLLGLARNDVRGPYLLPASEFKLSKLARGLSRKRNIDGLLHVAWRQRVEFGKEKASDFRLYAGKNFSDTFTYEGYPLPPEADANSMLGEQEGLSDETQQGVLLSASASNLVDEIEQALAALEQTDVLASEQASTLPILEVPLVPEHVKPEQVWELDGRFKLYLQNIGRVPYLHIDSHLNYRQPMVLDDMLLPEAFRAEALAEEGSAQPRYFLKPYPFMQLRRVISNQIHYFDHPMFGMVVQIRRYRLPSFMR
ncbi:CsiV family protein [Alteromonas sp. a30]|uniref:CsiV family protein n=1 Tax=Alteromonas sp. a30 TaxID=2730917 RepID=UPI00227E3B9A|nr:CsiV family protein [Alteromonas sp. a30]MCY7294222.1 hypothetical protein [Alteromonas sp. a30]